MLQRVFLRRGGQHGSCRLLAAHGGFARQPYRERGPLAFLAVYRDLSCVRLHNHFDKITAHSGAPDARHVAAPVVAVEQLIDVSAWDSNSPVLATDHALPFITLLAAPDQLA